MVTAEIVAPGVYKVDAIALKNTINVLLLENDDGWTLVDTGVGSSPSRIREALSALGSGPEDLKRVFITHQHDDHTGGLKGVLEWAPGAEVGASAHEAEVVSGRRGYDPQNNPVLRYLTRSAEPPVVITSSITTTRSPSRYGPSISRPVPCCLASLRTVNARSGRPASALA